MNKLFAGRKIRVLIVDDSALVRETLTDILQSDPEIEVMGTATDPFAAARRIQQEVPDVITLDIEMPRMDGLTFLRRIMAQRPVPVVVCSSLAEIGSETLSQAWEAGAVEIIAKPRVRTRAIPAGIENPHLRRREGSRTRPANPDAEPRRPRHAGRWLPAKKLTADVVLAAAGRRPGHGAHHRKRSSASAPQPAAQNHAGRGGGPTAASPGIVIVQHMPEKFTAAFARRLNSLCEMEVKEAADGDTVLRGRVLIAPGDRHTLLQRSGARYYVSVKEGPLVSRHRPSVDVLFRSAARYAGANAARYHHDRNGRRRGSRPPRDETGGGADDRPGRSHLGRLRHAKGSHRSRRRRQNPAARTAGNGNRPGRPADDASSQRCRRCSWNREASIAAASQALVRTVLGSCVAVCLLDRGGKGRWHRIIMSCLDLRMPTPVLVTGTSPSPN